MKKGKFYICSANSNNEKYQLVSGYIDTISGVEIGFHKNDKGRWYATHVKTGYYIIGGFEIRKDLATSLPYWLKKINFESASVQKAIENMNDFLKTVA